MKTEEQRIKIAEACGYRKTENWMWSQDRRSRVYLWDRPDRTKQQASSIPDYLGNLNAMAEAEKILDYDQAEQYESELWSIIMEFELNQENPKPSNFACMTATAAQRAEAFLRTIGKWTETPTTRDDE